MREGWVEISLGELTEKTRPICYGVLKPGPQVDGGIPLVKITDMDRRILGPEGMQQISKELDNEFRRSKLKGGEVLLSIQGTVGRVAIAASSLQGANISRTIAVIDPDERLMNFYLLYILEKIAAEGDFDSAGSTRESLNISTIRSMKIPCPSLPEQKRIVDLISSVDSYIEALEQQAESARKSRSAVLHEMLSAGGDGWSETTLGEVADVRDGTHDSPKQTPDGYALVTSKNITNGKLDLQNSYLISKFDYDEINKRSKVDLNDILISMIGTVGQAIQITTVPNFAIKNVGLIKTNDSELSSYLVLFLNSQLGQNEIIKNISGSTQKFIGLGKLRALKVILPPRQEQKRIIDLISSMDAGISATEKLINQTKQLRSGLLSDLLRGEHEIPESYDKVIGAA